MFIDNSCSHLSSPFFATHRNAGRWSIGPVSSLRSDLHAPCKPAPSWLLAGRSRPINPDRTSGINHPRVSPGWGAFLLPVRISCMFS